MKQRTFIDKCFKDTEGRVVIGQAPNLPIIIWILSTILQLITDGRLYELLNLIGFGALFTWAWLEIFSGVNYFRRFLGLVILIATLYSRVY